MRTNSFKSRLYAAITATPLAFMAVEEAKAADPVTKKSADPQITYEHPAAVKLIGGQQKRSVDCGTLYRFPEEPKRFWLTCRFARQVDSNDQPVCSNTDNLPADDKAKKAELSLAMYSAMTHFATVHGECQPQARNIARMLGKDGSYIKGNNGECSLVKAKDQCVAEYQKLEAK